MTSGGREEEEGVGFEGEGLELERVVDGGEADDSFAIGAMF